MTNSSKRTDYLRQGRKDRLIQERVHDTYKSKRKLPEPTVCPECGAVFHHGRWDWSERPVTAHEELCPACHRIHDKVPAGFLTLSGEFLSVHQDEIMNLIHNFVNLEKAEHPLKRMMSIEAQQGSLLITFTDPHLARGVGEALHHAYQGKLDFKYTEEDNVLRVSWAR
jgi:hypothetical protein